MEAEEKDKKETADADAVVPFQMDPGADDAGGEERKKKKTLTKSKKKERAKRASERRAKRRVSVAESAASVVPNATQRKFQRAFEEIDKDKSGELDFDELLDVCGGADADAGDVRALFEHLDEDGSGAVSAKELLRELKDNAEAREMASQFDGLSKILKIANRTKRKQAVKNVGSETSSRLHRRRTSLSDRLAEYKKRKVTSEDAATSEEQTQAKRRKSSSVRRRRPTRLTLFEKAKGPEV